MEHLIWIVIVIAIVCACVVGFVAGCVANFFGGDFSHAATMFAAITIAFFIGGAVAAR